MQLKVINHSSVPMVIGNEVLLIESVITGRRIELNNCHDTNILKCAYTKMYKHI